MDYSSAVTKLDDVSTLPAFAGLGMADVLTAQVREQEHQRKRKRTDKHGNPCPHFEAAASALGNSTGRIDRSDKNAQGGQGNGIHDGRSNAA
jgi:hypothetical protein